MDSHRESDEFRQSQSTHKIDEGVFRNQLTYVTLDYPVSAPDASLTNIEDARAPRVLRCIHFQICDKTCY